MTGLARILPVPNTRSPYDVAALNNLYASATCPCVRRLTMAPHAHRGADHSEDRTIDGNLAHGADRTPDSDAGSGAEHSSRLALLLSQLDDLASELAGDPEALLELLRQLEHLHRSIQDGPFRASLPTDRNQLFHLLQAMEGTGGWPYIPRLQLRTFMDLLQREQGHEETPDHPLAA